MDFTEENLRKLFGNEAAEDEDIDRLRQYYFKTSTYDEVTADLPLRILVGHKGIGKSALFSVARSEEKELDRIAVLIRPDDIAELGAEPNDFLKTIREWKTGISTIIARKILKNVGLESDSHMAKFKRWAGPITAFLDEVFNDSSLISRAAVKRSLVENYAKSKTVTVYIDDLDRGWQGREQDNIRISALLNAVRDIASESPGINFRISLRSDVYYRVRTSDESTDKLEGSVIWHTWTNHEIFVMLVKRVESFFSRTVDENLLLTSAPVNLAKYLTSIMEERFQGAGRWKYVPMYRILMSLIRKRPRDLVKLCTLAGKEAKKDSSSIIRTQHFENIFEEYSQGRLQDTINEYRSELASIERLLLSMKPTKKERTTKAQYVYPTDRLLQKISNIREQGEFRFANGMTASDKELAAFMYKINFLTARKEEQDGNINRKYFEENRYLSNQFVDFGFDWEVHPAYRWALQPDNIQDIFQHVSLSNV